MRVLLGFVWGLIGLRVLKGSWDLLSNWGVGFYEGSFRVPFGAYRVRST